MALLNQAIQNNGQLPKFFETLRAGTAPSSFTRQFLKDIGFKSSNHHAFIPLLKGLGFLTPDGTPTDRYRTFLDESRWRQVLAEAVRESYGDIFVLKAQPTSADLKMIAGKFKSTFNFSDLQADRAAKTFLSLLSMADPDTLYATVPVPTQPVQNDKQVAIEVEDKAGVQTVPSGRIAGLGLSYNIQIHLPATKDVETYNSIFKALREHLID